MMQVVNRQTGYARNASESAYPQLWRGLVGWWCPSINPRGGTRLFDLSPYQNHGTLTNMDAATDWVVSGGAGALDFDGVDDYVQTNYSRSNEFVTLSSWIKPTSVSPIKIILEKFDGVNVESNLYINNGVLTTYRTGFYSTGNISTNVWTHVALTASSATLTHYINGVSQSSASQTFTFRSGSYVVGARVGQNWSFSGQLDDIRIYNRALTPSEIKLLASERGIGLQPRPRHYTYTQLPTGAKRRRILTGMP